MARKHLVILPQPDDTACGPTCLHAIYRFYGDDALLDSVIAETHSLDAGGTLAVFLACHALRRGYRATIYTYNLHMFDPTWFATPGVDLAAKLREQQRLKTESRIQVATPGYLDYIGLGGKLLFRDLNAALLRRYLSRGVPIITGLSSTYLYREMREYGSPTVEDDVRGYPAGHFVALCGYDPATREVQVADPLEPNPFVEGRYYSVRMDRLVAAILLGVLTHDANLLVVEPPVTRGASGDHA